MISCVGRNSGMGSGYEVPEPAVLGESWSGSSMTDAMIFGHQEFFVSGPLGFRKVEDIMDEITTFVRIDAQHRDFWQVLKFRWVKRDTTDIGVDLRIS